MTAPCKDCVKMPCGSFHDKCTTYIKYREEVSRARKERNKVGDVEGYFKHRAYSLKREYK